MTTAQRDLVPKVASPSKVRLERDLLGEPYLAGERAGAWGDAEVVWPYLYVDVEVGDTETVRMRLDVEGYPQTAPAGVLWDPGQVAVLAQARWPVGGNAVKVWRTDWSPGHGFAPYMACDRVGLTTHPEWATAHAERAWNPSRTVVFYLSEMHRELSDAHLPEEDGS